MSESRNLTKVKPEVGMELTANRLITRPNIEKFAELTGDFGEHHVPKEGKAIAHGIYVASLITELGGRLNFISRRMDIEFVLPAYEGETLTSTITIRELTEKRLRYKATVDCLIENEAGDVVGRGVTYGQIMKETP